MTAKNFKQYNFLNYKLFKPAKNLPVKQIKPVLQKKKKSCTYLKHQYLPSPEE